MSAICWFNSLALRDVDVISGVFVNPFYWASDCLSMLELKLNHVIKREPMICPEKLGQYHGF